MFPEILYGDIGGTVLGVGLSAAIAKPLLELLASRLRQNAADDVDFVMGGGAVGQINCTADAPGFEVVCSVDQAVDTPLKNGSGTHRARF